MYNIQYIYVLYIHIYTLFFKLLFGMREMIVTKRRSNIYISFEIYVYMKCE